MKIRIFLLVCFMFITNFLYGFNFTQQTDTVFNQTDQNGLKQGFWKKYYPNGQVKYRGQFLNDHPTGIFYRFYDNGPLQSVQSFRNDGSSFVKIYYQNGILAAEGKFLGTKKDSIWRYYSFYGGYLSYIESYKKGLKDGTSKKYYEKGSISQELSWRNGKKDGSWKIWFPNGQLQLESSFSEGKLNGTFTTYYPDGDIEIRGTYKNDVRVGTWTLTNPGTKKRKKIKYVNGVREDQGEIDKAFEEQLNKIEKSKGKIKDPYKSPFQK